MKRLAMGVAVVLAVTMATGWVRNPNGRQKWPRKHPLPVVCIDIGFNEDGTPIIECP